jgi:hypothetical protein
VKRILKTEWNTWDKLFEIFRRHSLLDPSENIILTIMYGLLPRSTTLTLVVHSRGGINPSDVVVSNRWVPIKTYYAEMRVCILKTNSVVSVAICLVRAVHKFYFKHIIS